MLTEDCDVIVIGAGAAGLLAAARAAERGRRTILLEKNRKAGVKILMSGGTRCNITHDCDARGIVAAFGKQGAFLHSALATLSPRDVVALFHAEGVQTKVESTGKIFPASDRALDVRDALVRRLLRSGAAMLLGEPVVDVMKTGGGFVVTTPMKTMTCSRLLITTGGVSYPGCGTTGDGYGWAERMGHRIVPPRPALTPILTGSMWTKALSGLTMDVGLQICVPGGRPGSKENVLAADCGSMLFTHQGFSGPAPLNVSKGITRHAEPRRLQLACDFLPRISIKEWEAELRRRSRAFGKRRPAGLLDELPNRLADALIEQLGLNPEGKSAELSNLQLAELTAACKATRLPISGTLGFEKAEVTSGGVALEEVDSRTMESKKTPGLFLAGEILDLDGKIGGFNFQSAFSTGWVAASHL